MNFKDEHVRSLSCAPDPVSTSAAPGLHQKAMSIDNGVIAPKSSPEKSTHTSPGSQPRSPGVGAEKSPKKRNSDQSNSGTPSLIKRQLSVSAMSPR